MDHLETFFWFFINDMSAKYISDGLLAVMITENGPTYMRSRDQSKSFDKRNKTVISISENMTYKHKSATLNVLLIFIENIYKNGYTFTKDKYIKEKRPDMMKAIQIIETRWIDYLNKKNVLEISMDFDEMRLDILN